MKTALLIIDVQNIMFSYGNGVYIGEEVVENIHFLLTKAREESVPVIYIQHTEDEGSFEVGNLDREIHSRLKPGRDEIVIPKYS